MSYDVEYAGERTTFDDGTSLLVTGDTSHTDELLDDAVVPAADSDERTIVVTMNRGAQAVASAFQERGGDPDRLGIIDCTGHEGTVDEVEVRGLNSPGDLTGISLEFAKLYDEIGDETDPVRVGFASISTALMYDELRTVFRFLHVFTARIRAGDMFGVFTLDPSMHEPQAHNTIRAVFDCEARIGEDDGGDALELRGSGFEQ